MDIFSLYYALAETEGFSMLNLVKIAEFLMKAICI